MLSFREERERESLTRTFRSLFPSPATCEAFSRVSRYDAAVLTFLESLPLIAEHSSQSNGCHRPLARRYRDGVVTRRIAQSLGSISLSKPATRRGTTNDGESRETASRRTNSSHVRTESRRSGRDENDVRVNVTRRARLASRRNFDSRASARASARRRRSFVRPSVRARARARSRQKERAQHTLVLRCVSRVTSRGGWALYSHY